MKRPLIPMLLRGLQQPGPVILMVHGYKYEPGHASACPHDSILGMKTRRESRTARSWPRGLGFGSGVSREGLGIAFGWPARGTIWQAYGQARIAGRALADLIAKIQQLAPEREIHALTHSLGARVLLSALPRLPTGSVGRVILLSGAEFGSLAEEAVESPAGKTAEFINITSRENDLFDFMLERLVSSPRRHDRSLAHAMPQRVNTLTLQMDHPQTLDKLRRCGFRIASPATRISHWSSYMRPGVFSLYRALLRRSAQVDLGHLQSVLPTQPEPRWSRIIPLSMVRPGLPGGDRVP
ncbi:MULTISPECIES: alpha/beta hydrolase [unclassified Roseovarius]|uniref:alpha/beta hydrolase n=1 Tax=unclassified Roseovarius TaxID=2614913 RepID=UPI00273EA90F|nr:MULTISPECIES: alpha/beta hydrolase [unclassified Roseovarius]